MMMNDFLITEQSFSTAVAENQSLLGSSFKHTEDFTSMDLSLAGNRCLVCFLATAVDMELVNSQLVRMMLVSEDLEEFCEALMLGGAESKATIGEGKQALLEGNVLLLFEGQTTGIAASVRFNKDLPPEDPKSEKGLFGNHLGFVSSLDTNLSLIRRQNASDDLTIKYAKTGVIQPSQVGLIYLDNLADKQMIASVQSIVAQLANYEINTVQQIRPLIMKSAFSPFPQILITERLDKAIHYLNQGKLILIMDGSSSVAILPVTFFNFFETADDLLNNAFVGSFFYHLRILGFLIALLLPSVYISLVSFHSDILPTSILYTFKLGTEYVPLNPLVEAILMQLILELLREASARLPSSIANTIGVVGGLVIGNAIVEVNFVSKPMIIVIALTAIAAFTNPIAEMSSVARIMGLSFVCASALFGFLGLSIVFLIMLMHLCDIEIAGLPYFSLRSMINAPVWSHQKKLDTIKRSLHKKN
ncbi:spore germination protein [Paenibacillus sp. P36]|uniref:spore germination protein n=1 Tax=Paenibacillus sp. P36 TaxID=3342538 RepID=UPI0038B359CF